MTGGYAYRIETIGKYRYALGLEWFEATEGVKESIAYLDDQGQPLHYVVIAPKSGTPTVGYLRGPLKGRVASYAATLATVAEDGIYTAVLDDGRWWYCVISAHQVVASTDRVMPEAEARETIETMRATFDLAVYASSDIVANATLFDPVAIIAKTKPQWLRRRGTSLQDIVVAILIFAIATPLFYWAYRTLIPEERQFTGPTPEQIRANYIEETRNQLPALPQDPQWVSNAYRVARAMLPVYRAGWVLDRVSCQPAGGCNGAYVPMPDGIWRSHEGLGAPPGLNLDGSSLNAPVDTPLVILSDEDILAYPNRYKPLSESLGLYGLKFAVGKLESAPQVTTYGPATTPPEMLPPEAQPLVVEKFVLLDGTVLDEITLHNIVAYFARDGFVATGFELSGGYAGRASGWKIEFVRLQGQH
jgi:hypothetical protein